MKILSIETSCDDTGITIFEAKGSITNASFKILADSLASQTKIHIPYGGVFPVLAKREHAKNLPILLEKTLKKAKISNKFFRQGLKNSVDMVAVTYGPGLEMCLWEGITFAKNLAKKWNVPLVPVNHMEGHIISVFGKHKGNFKIPKIKYPFLSLLVSGGHTELILCKKWMEYELIGETVDDAVGEAFDKVARMLGLPYPGGPEISKLAEGLREKQAKKGLRSATARVLSKNSAEFYAYPSKLDFSLKLPRPMLHSKNFDFSFSGLKTAVLYLIRDIEKSGKKIDTKTKAQIALEFENSAIECLVYKTAKAIEKHKINTLLVGGGVAANKHLRKELKKITKNKIKLILPTKELSRDNSIMIGMAGYLNYLKFTRHTNNKNLPEPESIKATGNLRL